VKPILLKFQLIVIGLVVLIMTTWAIYNIIHQNSEESVKKPSLRIMTYSSFMLPSGPGPILKSDFESHCKCQVEFVDGGDSSLFIENIKYFPERKIDLVLGVSILHLKRAREELKWKKMPWREDVQWEEVLEIPTFFMGEGEVDLLPFSWAPMTMIYRKGEISPPASWQDLLKPEYRKTITAQDPRYSLPGMHLVLWASKSGEESGLNNERMKALVHSLMTLSSNWSASYGLFRKKNALMTFSYVTSLVYHWVEEKDRSYQAAIFSEGHPFEVELAGIPESCVNCLLAQKFAIQLVNRKWQDVLMQKNYMLPVVKGVRDGSEFSKVPSIPLLSMKGIQRFGSESKERIKQYVDHLKMHIQ